MRLLDGQPDETLNCPFRKGLGFQLPSLLETSLKVHVQINIVQSRHVLGTLLAPGICGLKVFEARCLCIKHNVPVSL